MVLSRIRHNVDFLVGDFANNGEFLLTLRSENRV